MCVLPLCFMTVKDVYVCNEWVVCACVQTGLPVLYIIVKDVYECNECVVRMC